MGIYPTLKEILRHRGINAGYRKDLSNLLTKHIDKHRSTHCKIRFIDIKESIHCKGDVAHERSWIWHTELGLHIIYLLAMLFIGVYFYQARESKYE